MSTLENVLNLTINALENVLKLAISTLENVINFNYMYFRECTNFLNLLAYFESESTMPMPYSSGHNNCALITHIISTDRTAITNHKMGG